MCYHRGVRLECQLAVVTNGACLVAWPGTATRCISQAGEACTATHTPFTASSWMARGRIPSNPGRPALRRPVITPTPMSCVNLRSTALSAAGWRGVGPPRARHGRASRGFRAPRIMGDRPRLRCCPRCCVGAGDVETAPATVTPREQASLRASARRWRRPTCLCFASAPQPADARTRWEGAFQRTTLRSHMPNLSRGC